MPPSESHANRLFGWNVTRTATIRLSADQRQEISKGAAVSPGLAGRSMSGFSAGP